MAVLLWTLAAALAVVLALAIAVLATPVRLGFRLRASPGLRLTVFARLLGGLTPAIPIHDSARRRRRAKKPAPPKPRSRASPGGAARARRALAASPGLVAGLLRPIRLTRLAVDADIGLADPADTGELFGLISALRYSRALGSGASIALRPDFNGPRAEGEVEAELSFTPAAFIPPGLRFAWRVYGARS